MKILIYGYGKIGIIHAKNFKKFGQIYVYDIKKIKNLDLNYKTIKNLDLIKNNFFDLTIICTPTANHISDLLNLNKLSKFFLIEKPISTNYKNFSVLNDQMKKKIIVCCNMRFHKGIKIIKNNIKLCGKIYYLQNYFKHSLKNMNRAKNNYIFKEKNSLSILYDCIHDLDYLNFLFGLKKISYIHSKKFTNNHLPKDYIQVLSEFENNIYGSTILNFIDQFKFRGLEITGSKGTLVWKSEGKIKEKVTVDFYKKDKIINLFKSYNFDSNTPYMDMAYEVNQYLKDSKRKVNKYNLSFFKDASYLIKLINHE